MISYYVQRARQQQRDLALADFTEFCHDQLVRIRATGVRGDSDLPEIVLLGAPGQKILLPEVYDLTVRR